MAEPIDEPDAARVEALANELRLIGGKLKRRLREQAHLEDLTSSQIAVLARLERDGPATVTELARAEGMRPQSMGAIIAALEAAGHVSGESDPEDGRRTILSLTEQCRAWIKHGRAARQDWLIRTIRGQLNPAEQEQLIAALVLLARLVDS